MKHFSYFIALLATALTLAACQPTDLFNERTIVYTTESESGTVHLTTESEFDALLDRFCNLAEGGSTVTFRNTAYARQGSGTKESATYSTTNREDMKNWMRRMEDEGRTVTVIYEKETGIWRGTAYPQTPNNPSKGLRASRIATSSLSGILTKK